MARLAIFELSSWEASVPESIRLKALESLEKGEVLYLPTLSFPLKEEEHPFFSPKYLDPKRKNISYNLKTDQMGGVLPTAQGSEILKEMLKRYASMSRHFLQNLIPHYTPTLTLAKTSFRPMEIAGRKSSMRKDDTRLHVDAFPSNPTRGKRILRMFTNVNPEGKPRVWRIGEPFEEVVKKYACQVPSRLPGMAQLLKLLNITKEQRSPYDHFMLHIHNKMKEDSHYQQSVSQEEVRFPPGSSWIVFTDQVSHAAMSGQYVLEQTYSLPSEGLKDVSTAPIKVLEKCLHRTLS
jgi:hypothetical protein